MTPLEPGAGMGRREGTETWVAGWRLDSGEVIDLLQPAQIRSLPPGTVVTSIFGDTKVVGRDAIDDDTRAGFTAYGIPCPRGDTTVHVDD